MERWQVSVQTISFLAVPCVRHVRTGCWVALWFVVLCYLCHMCCLCCVGRCRVLLYCAVL